MLLEKFSRLLACLTLGFIGCHPTPTQLVGQSTSYRANSIIAPKKNIDSGYSSCLIAKQQGGAGVWSISQERQCNGKSLSATVLIRSIHQPNSINNHCKLAASRAWLLLGLIELREQHLSSATSCLRSGIRELAEISEDPHLRNQTDFTQNLNKTIYGQGTISESKIKNLATVLSYQIMEYTRNHISELAENWYSIFIKCNSSSCDKLMTLSDHPGQITSAGELPSARWPLLSSFLTIDLQIVDASKEHQLLTSYKNASNFSDFLSNFQKNEYIIRQWKPNE